MKLKKLACVIIGIIFILVILITINVQASNSLKATIQSSKSELKKAEKAVITLKLEEYQDVKEGINAYKATLDYDENIFEQVLEQNFVCKNDWEMLKYNKDSKEFIAIKKAGSKEPEEVASITLTVKEEIEPKQTDIKIKDIVTSDGKKDINILEAKVTIDIIKEQDVEPEQPEKITSEKYKIEEEYIWAIPVKTTVADFKQNVTTSSQIELIDENGNILQEDSLIKTGAKLKAGKALQFTLIVAGDIDKDAEITINDLAQMKLHLIERKLLTGIHAIAADIDIDNEISINDLAQIKLILIGSEK